MSSVILVDDEKLARDRLRRMLNTQDYQVVAEAANGREAIELVQQHQPDILLLDIRMPGMDGLEAARHISAMEQPPAIVFCTAYDEYAIDAFDVQAVGYVLKPVRREQLSAALARAGRVSGSQLAGIQPERSQRTHLAVKTHLGLELIPVDQISHFMAGQKYVTAFVDGREVVVDESLKQLAGEFVEGYLRIHRNCIVALSHVEGLMRTHSGKSEIKLRGSRTRLAVSRRHLTAVKKVLSEI